MRLTLWEVVELVGFALVVLATYKLFGPGWGLFAGGLAVIIAANTRSR